MYAQHIEGAGGLPSSAGCWREVGCQSIVAKVGEPSNQSTASEYFFSRKQIGKKSFDFEKVLLRSLLVILR